MIRKVVEIPDKRLREHSTKVKKIDKKVNGLINDMWDTLAAQKDPEGIGLAAPQVGKNIKIFIINYEETKEVFINPEITEKSKLKIVKEERGKDNKKILEGCLSLPHYYSPISRPDKITVKYTNKEGKIITKKISGFLAQIVQHEVDHLEGTIFVDHTVTQKAPLYKVTGDEWEKVEL